MFSFERIRQFLREWFDLNGRMPRAPYIKRFFGVFFIGMFFMLALGNEAMERSGNDLTVVNSVMLAVLIVATLVLYPPMVKRLHDFGHGQKMAIAFEVFAVLQGFCLSYIRSSFYEDPGNLFLQVYQILLIAAMVYLIVLVFHKGTRGSNAYGPSPFPAVKPPEDHEEKTSYVSHHKKSGSHVQKGKRHRR